MGNRFKDVKELRMAFDYGKVNGLYGAALTTEEAEWVISQAEKAERYERAHKKVQHEVSFLERPTREHDYTVDFYWGIRTAAEIIDQELEGESE